MYGMMYAFGKHGRKGWEYMGQEPKPLGLACQVCAVTNTDGTIIPRWFKYQDPQTMEICSVLIDTTERADQYGNNLIYFHCRCASDGMDTFRNATLIYAIRECQWFLRQ
jgi:hypothetical protein